ncbi:MAG: hypothetical protein ABFD53_07205 [Anaerolineaceae bacterium]
MLGYIAIAGLILIIFALIGIIVSDNWRFTIICLSVQYLGCVLILIHNLPFVLAASKLIAGWIAAAILGMAIAGLPAEEMQWLGYNAEKKEGSFRSQRIFRLLIALMMALVVISIVPKIREFVPGIENVQSFASALMISLSIIQLSLISRPFDVVVGLLVLLSGFEIMYFVVETSALVTGLLEVIDLGLALVGAYLIIAPTLEHVE